MVVKIRNLRDWAEIPADSMLELAGGKLRKVRIEVNCPAPTRFDVVEDGRLRFLAVVSGFEVLEFFAGGGGAFALAWDGEVAPWYLTKDGDNNTINRPEAKTFTTIANRQPRNLEMERLMWTARQNQMRLEASLNAQMEAMRAEVEKLREAADEPEAGAVGDAGGAADGTDDGAGAAGEAGGEVVQVAAVSPAKKAKGAKPNGSGVA